MDKIKKISKKADTPATRKARAPRCGLCGKTKNLIKTDCCGQWICDDEHKYVAFSHARNSCSRNHRRYTLCGHHFVNEHAGDWKECPACRNSFKTEMYVWYGTNEYNFEKLENPPSYEPTRCDSCKKVIVLAEEGYSIKGDEYMCEKCTDVKFEEFRRRAKKTTKG